MKKLGIWRFTNCQWLYDTRWSISNEMLHGNPLNRQVLLINRETLTDRFLEDRAPQA